VLNKIDLINDADASGTASTMYSGTKTITTDSYGGSFRLRESTRNIQTFNARNGLVDTSNHIFTNCTDYTDGDNNWTGVPYLSSFTISAVASQGWWYTVFADEIPDLYIVVKDGLNQVIYNGMGLYLNNTNPPVTFSNLNILLSNPPYTVELWDYNAVGANDFGGSYSITTNAGTQSWSGGGNNGTYTNNTLNNPALDVHWGMEKTYDFYQSVFSRNSYDGNGSIIKNFVNGTMQIQNTQNNAFSLPSPYNIMVYGMGDGSIMNPVVGLDVEGHEFSHMVTANNGHGGLTYQKESGSLNESFSDIFGTCIEFYGASSPNWTI
jgi:Zn-dependent metalloprotease